jgi:hypothetical protein
MQPSVSNLIQRVDIAVKAARLDPGAAKAAQFDPAHAVPKLATR